MLHVKYMKNVINPQNYGPIVMASYYGVYNNNLCLFILIRHIYTEKTTPLVTDFFCYLGTK